MYSSGCSYQIVMNLFFLDRFLKNIWISHSINVQWGPSSVTQTNGHDLANSCFCKFVNAPKNMLVTYFHAEQYQWYSAILNELVLFLH
jgi:hypothetical protein